MRQRAQQVHAGVVGCRAAEGGTGIRVAIAADVQQPQSVEGRLVGGQALQRPQQEGLPGGARIPGDRILITGHERGVITFANCCLPIPGDEIMGYHTTGKGIVVHRLDCPNVADYRKSPERWIAIGWDREVSGDFHSALMVEVENRPGVLAQVAAAIAQAESNIDGVEYLERDSNVAQIRFAIEVRDRRHIADVIRKVRRLGVVYGVQRL